MLSYRTCEASETNGFSARACEEDISTRDKPHSNDEAQVIHLET